MPGEVLIFQMGINHSGFDVAVPHDLLQYVQVTATPQEFCGKGVPPYVHADFFAYTKQCGNVL